MLRQLLGSIMRQGTVTVIRPGAPPLVVGTGAPHITMRLHDRRALYELGLNPDLKFGELYVDGRMTVEDGSIRDLLDLLMGNLAAAGVHGRVRLRRALRWL